MNRRKVIQKSTFSWRRKKLNWTSESISVYILGRNVRISSIKIVMDNDESYTDSNNNNTYNASRQKKFQINKNKIKKSSLYIQWNIRWWWWKKKYLNIIFLCVRALCFSLSFDISIFSIIFFRGIVIAVYIHCWKPPLNVIMCVVLKHKYLFNKKKKKNPVSMYISRKNRRKNYSLNLTLGLFFSFFLSPSLFRYFNVRNICNGFWFFSFDSLSILIFICYNYFGHGLNSSL